MPKQREYYLTHVAAKLAGVSPDTLRGWMFREKLTHPVTGKLIAYKVMGIWRIDRAGFDAWLEALYNE